MEVLRVDFHAKDADKQFTKSLKNTGFAVLYNHDIDQQLIDDVYSEWTDFFFSDYKNSYLFNKETQDGFFPANISETAKGNTLKDIKEFFQVYPWGQFPSQLSNSTKKLYADLSKMAITLLNWVENHTPDEIRQSLSMPLRQMIEDSNLTMLRILHYPPFSGAEEKGAVRAAAHGDINLLTLLVGATQSGLQVQDMDGYWHDVPCDKNSIAVNIGDMLEMCTQGYFHSTLHRVINPSNERSNTARLSMPLFLHPRSEVRLSNTHTAGDFLQERLKELGVK